MRRACCYLYHVLLQFIGHGLRIHRDADDEFDVLLIGVCRQPLDEADERALGLIIHELEEIINEVEGLTIASVRATLSSLATKGLATKEKAEFDGKMKTKFTAVVSE